MNLNDSLRISGAVLLSLAVAAPALSATCGTSVTVRSGDTLAGIAQRCQTNVGALLAANPDIDNPNVIRVGQSVAMPDSGQRAKPPGPPGAERGPAPHGGYYAVRPGDTLYEIARAHETSVDALLRLNPEIGNPGRLHVGFRLRIGNNGVVIGPPEMGPPGPPPRGRDAKAVANRHAGPPGTTVRIRASGFPADRMVKVGAGPVDSEYSVLKRVRTNAQGRISTTVRVPNHAEVGDRWVFVVATPRNTVEAKTGVFQVAGESADPLVRFRPESGPPGSTIQVQLRDYPPRTRVEIGMSERGESMKVVASGRTDDEGRLVTRVRVPNRYDPGDRLTIGARVAGGGASDRAGTFRVTDRDGRDGRDNGNVVQLSGRLTDEGIECQTLRTSNGRLYSLTNVPDRFDTGDRVELRGTVADTSFCMQGRDTINVERMRKR